MPRMYAVDTIKQGKELIEDESTWIKGMTAMDAEGKYVNPNDDSAVRFCMLGAMTHVHHSKKPNLQRIKKTMIDIIVEKYGHSRVMYRDPDECPGVIVTNFNDHGDTTHDQVIEVMEEAINRLS